MKPIRVVMSAFGSYAGVVEVDFEKVNQGIFLITGDTGSGKTTIFDAITYALYDQTSGGRRDGDMMRSEYADDDTLTYVELTFLYNGEQYQIRRNPNFLRRSKRKNKDGEYTVAQEMASVELIMPDGKPFYGKMKETNQKIIDIIGLDVNQFTQIAMIAQGEFMKLLLAPSKERKEIFAKIFDTRIYWRVQKELSERAKTLYGKLMDNQKSIGFQLDNVALCDKSEYALQWQESGKFSESAQEDVLELLKQIIEEVKKKEEELKGVALESSKDLDNLKEQIRKGNEINQLFEAFDKLTSDMKALEEKTPAILEKREKIRLARNAAQVLPKEMMYENLVRILMQKRQQIERLMSNSKQMEEQIITLQELKKQKELELEQQSPVLIADIAKLKDCLPRFEQLLQKQQELKEAKVQEQQGKSIFDQEILTQEQLKKKILSVNEQVEQKKDSSTKVVKLEQELAQLGVLYKDMDALITMAAELDALMKNVETCKQSTQQALKVYQQKSAMYEQLNEAFILEQVGIIASELHEGQACPVCGSTSHPHPAPLSKEAVTQALVTKAKQERELADEKKSKDSDALALATQKMEAKRSTIYDNGIRLFGQEFAYTQEWLNDISKQRSESLTKGKEVRKKLEEERLNQQTYEKLLAELTQLTKNVETSATNLETYRTKWNQLQLLVGTLGKEELLLKEGLPYASANVAKEILTTKESALKGLETNCKRVTEQYQSVYEQFQKNAGELKNANDEQELQQKECTTLEQAYQEAITFYGFESKDEYLANKTQETDIKNWEEECSQHELAVSKLTAKLQIYKEQTDGKQKVDLSSLLEKSAVLEEKLKNFEQKNKEYYAILQKDEAAYQNTREALKIRKKLREDYECMSRLDKTANGKLSGLAGLDFQTYIQRRYFKSIIHEANKRLVVMSSNRFILQCRDFKDLGKQGEVGLNLDVYSLVNDKTRDVKTLSGGESFMAALSMALGMADVMQNTAGKIHLDTMFIDEGFGSLDEESRTQAITILNDLAGDRRLVGIISHVTELKEQIERKLIVKKTAKGSEIAWNL